MQTNYGGVLTMNGAPVGRELGQIILKDKLEAAPARSSVERAPEDKGGRVTARAPTARVMIVVATARRSTRSTSSASPRAPCVGLARTGLADDHGSGDYVIAFHTAPQNRVRASERLRRSSCWETKRRRRSFSPASRRPKRPSTTRSCARPRRRAAAACASRRCLWRGHRDIEKYNALARTS